MVFTPRTAPRDPDRIVEVFLSATAKDLKDQRTQVQGALALVASFIVLQEDWADAAANSYLLSIQRVNPMPESRWIGTTAEAVSKMAARHSCR